MQPCMHISNYVEMINKRHGQDVRRKYHLLIKKTHDNKGDKFKLSIDGVFMRSILGTSALPCNRNTF